VTEGQCTFRVPRRAAAVCAKVFSCIRAVLPADVCRIDSCPLGMQHAAVPSLHFVLRCCVVLTFLYCACAVSVLWCRAFAASAQAIHETCVIHRDIKPANIFMCPDNVVKVRTDTNGVPDYTHQCQVMQHLVQCLQHAQCINMACARQHIHSQCESLWACMLSFLLVALTLPP
jgi:hypothetical protein